MRTTLLSLLIFTSTITFGQSLEGGLFLGGFNYLGDLSPVAFTTKETKPAIGIFARYTLTSHWAFRGQFNYGTISGTDANQTNSNLVRRNLSFRSRIWEVDALVEYNIFPFSPCDAGNLTPYVYAGLNLFHFNPKANYQGSWVALQPLGTEGQGLSAFPQRKPYSRYQIAMPMGFGIKYSLRNGWVIAGEAGLRKTFTDYLDDVSNTYVSSALLLAERGETAAALSNRTGEIANEPRAVDENTLRGNPNNKDWYMMFGFTISKCIGCNGKGLFGKQKNPARCFDFNN